MSNRLLKLFSLLIPIVTLTAILHSERELFISYINNYSDCHFDFNDIINWSILFIIASLYNYIFFSSKMNDYISRVLIFYVIYFVQKLIVNFLQIHKLRFSL